MTRNRDLRGIVFDLDGTLADTIVDLAGSVNSVLERRGFPTHPVDSFRLMVGDGFAKLISRALPKKEAEDNAVFASVLSEARKAYADGFLSNTGPFEGIPSLLGELDARGLSLAVLSNKPQELTEAMVKALFPTIDFVATFGDRPGVPRKPDPTAALDLAGQAGIPPESWAFVGDSGVDMRTAKAAGMFACGALWGYRDAAELSRDGADLLLAHPAEILGLFG